MTYHIGSEIHKILKKKGMTVSEFARRINSSRENAYSIFKRKSVDTELLQTISRVLQHDFFGKIIDGSSKSNYYTIASEPDSTYVKVDHELNFLRQEVLFLRRDMQEIRDRLLVVEKSKKK